MVGGAHRPTRSGSPASATEAVSPHPLGFTSQESTMFNRIKFVAATLLATVSMALPAVAQTAICYNCPPEWADWGTQLKLIKEKTGITVPQDNKNSGQSLSQLVAEKGNPVADVTYLGVTFGIQAKKEGVVTGYKPAKWADIPDGLKDPDGAWFTTRARWASW